MKKVIAILMFGLIVFVTAACGGMTQEEEIKEFVKEYKTKQYKVEDPHLLEGKTAVESVEEINSLADRIKPYVSKEVLDDFVSNRWLMQKVEVAQAVDKKVKLKDVTLEKVEENEDGSIDYDYTLEINYYDEESEEIVEKEGELTIINEDGWQIIRDWEKITKFEKEAMRKYLEEQSKGNGSKDDETDE